MKSIATVKAEACRDALSGQFRGRIFRKQPPLSYHCDNCTNVQKVAAVTGGPPSTQSLH